MKKILITGGNGLLGTYIQDIRPEEYYYFPTHYNSTQQWRQLDITDKVSIYRLFSDFKFDVIIHTAGLGNVDFCERVPHISDLVNYEGAKNLIDILNELKQKPLFVQISTNAVYDGNNPLYDEESIRRPINKYGFSKKLAEEYVMNRYENWLVIRPFMLFGWSYKTNRKNWLETLTYALGMETKMNLINDIFWQPTSARWAAEIIRKLIDKEIKNECFNLSQGETMSLYNFALLITKVWKGNKELFNPVSANEFKTLAKRPVNTSYDVSKLKSMFEIPTVEEELRRFYG